MDGAARDGKGTACVTRCQKADSRDSRQLYENTVQTEQPPYIRCISSCRVDGGTTIEGPTFDNSVLKGRFAAFLADARSEETSDDLEKLTIPVGDARGVLRGIELLDKHLVCLVSSEGRRGERVLIQFPDACVVWLNCDMGRIRITFRAKALWSSDVGDVFGWWIDAFSDALGLGRVPLDHAHKCGWRVTALELCSDFTRLNIGPRDADAWVGARKVGMFSNLRSESVETLELGRRKSSNLSICIYDKTAELKTKRGKAKEANYLASWHASGWDGVENVWRVEARFRKRALELEHTADDVDPETGEVFEAGTKRNFRNPATVADARARAWLWRYATSQRRLVKVETRKGQATRLKRAETDPRWRAVQQAVAVTQLSFRQTREVQVDTWHARWRLARRRYAVAARQVAALTGTEFHPRETAALAEITCELEGERDEFNVYELAYRSTQEQVIGEEIRDLGGDVVERAENISGYKFTRKRLRADWFIDHVRALARTSRRTAK